MTKRPLSVTIICWFLIIGAGISFISSVISINSPAAREIMANGLLPVNIQYLIMFVSLTVSLVCGIAMLKRQNWARFLYIVWSVVGFIITLASSPMKTLLIPAIIVFLIIAYFLFRPMANEYFKATATPAVEHGS